MNWIWLGVGILIGILMTMLTAMWCRFEGLIRLHPGDDGERPYLFLELNKEPEKMLGKKYVIFKVHLDSR